MCGLWCMKTVTALLVALTVAVTEDEPSQELLKQSDEDLFFLEGLLVIDPDNDTDASEGLLVIDPDKGTDASEDYNSLEAPKDALDDDNSPHAASLQPNEPQAARLQPTHNYMISISDLANAYVTPRSSEDNHYEYSYFRSSEETSDVDDRRKTSGQYDRREIRDDDYNIDTSDEDIDYYEGSAEYEGRGRKLFNWTIDTSDEDIDYYEGSAEYEGSGRKLFNWTIEGNDDDNGSGEMEASGDDNVGQEEVEDVIYLLAEEDLEEFTPIKEENLSAELDSHSIEDYDEGNSIGLYSPMNTNLVIHGYRGSPIGDMAKIDILETEMYQIKGQISQLTARMEQHSNDIGHLQRIILQLQEQINRIVYKQNHLIHV